MKQYVKRTLAFALALLLAVSVVITHPMGNVYAADEYVALNWNPGYGDPVILTGGSTAGDTAEVYFTMDADEGGASLSVESANSTTLVWMDDAESFVRITAFKYGKDTVTITAVNKTDPSIKAELTVDVIVLPDVTIKITDGTDPISSLEMAAGESRDVYVELSGADTSVQSDSNFKVELTYGANLTYDESTHKLTAVHAGNDTFSAYWAYYETSMTETYPGLMKAPEP